MPGQRHALYRVVADGVCAVDNTVYLWERRDVKVRGRGRLVAI